MNYLVSFKMFSSLRYFLMCLETLPWVLSCIACAYFSVFAVQPSITAAVNLLWMGLPILSVICTFVFFTFHACGSRIAYYNISALQRVVLDFTRLVFVATGMFVLTTYFEIQAVHFILSEFFVPLDSEDETGEVAGGCIVGTFMMLPFVLVFWGILSVAVWIQPFLDARQLLALNKSNKQEVDDEIRIMLDDGNWRDDISEGTEQHSDTESI